MSRPLFTWGLFALCLLGVLGGMGWVTATALELDEAQTEAAAKAELEDAVRLTLWRMDSALTPFIAQETGRPHRFYLEEGRKAPVDWVRAHLLYDEKEGRLSTPDLGRSGELVALTVSLGAEALHAAFPEAPVEQGELLALARPGARPRQIPDAEIELRKKRAGFRKEQLVTLSAEEPERLAKVRKEKARTRVEFDKRAQAVQRQVGNYYNPTNDDFAEFNQQAAPPLTTEQVEETKAKPEPQPAQKKGSDAKLVAPTEQVLQQASQGSLSNLFGGGTAALPGNLNALDNNLGLGAAQGWSPAAPPRLLEVATGTMRPLWFEGHLLMLRRAQVEGRRYLEGAWLDWPVIEAALLEEARDLLPEARLVPASSPLDDSPRLLATLPVRLVPGALPSEARAGLQPLTVSLAIAWACVLAAALAVFGLLLGAVSLSERRGAFVSSVTHELRTPLTTFKMYTEMLSEGMVSPDRQGEYFQTLHREADRLAALVENVLAYARIEGRRYASRIESLPLPELLERIAPRLSERALQAGLTLELKEPPEVQVMADPQALEQVLFNLVDNAAKYAGPQGGPIEVMVGAAEERILLRVRDHGPGIPAADRKTIFRPFAKSSRHLSGTAPGVGLGLALCRRLAQQMGGSLELEDPEEGASFLLTLRAGR
ncbi:MAG: HAMP domain-containing sensor histidine kinase [Deltaproteobacteria bacterium]|nr:HAMP domain-containing sensor histidine kinase [Deltaproteobacteria bacterium]